MTLTQKQVREALALIIPRDSVIPTTTKNALLDLEEAMQALRTEHGTQEIVDCKMCQRLRVYFEE